MNNIDFFSGQLKYTEELIEHCILETKPERLSIPLPHLSHPKADEKTKERIKSVVGEWPLLRILFHLVVYEEQIAYPEMRRFILNENPSIDGEKWENDDNKLWKEDLNPNNLLSRFKDIRAKQISLLQNCTPEILNEITNDTSWGPQKLNFVINKTLQHTISHGSKLYSKKLFWDMFLETLNKK